MFDSISYYNMCVDSAECRMKPTNQRAPTPSHTSDSTLTQREKEQSTPDSRHIPISISYSRPSGSSVVVAMPADLDPTPVAAPAGTINETKTDNEKDKQTTTAAPQPSSSSSLSKSSSVRTLSLADTLFPRPRFFPSESWPTPPLAQVTSESGRDQLATQLSTQPTGSPESFQRLVIGTTFSSYIGDTLNGLPHGHGRCEFKAGQTYEGQFEHGLMHGRGCYTWQDGSSYTGIMNHHSATGTGLIVWSDGSSYEGEVQDGYRHGEGVFIDPAVPCLYEGTWQRGLRHGKGKLTYDDLGHSYYEGQWFEGARHGYGLLRYKSGNLYEGNWLWDRKVGQGTMNWFTLNQRYIGEWLNDLPHGSGEYTWLDLPVGGARQLDSVRTLMGHSIASSQRIGPVTHFQHHNRYVGAWVQGVREGEGTFHYSTGAIYSGSWSHDRKHGLGTFTFPNGSVSSGEFLEDIFQDTLRWKHPYTGVADVIESMTNGAPTTTALTHSSRTAKALEAATTAAQKDIGMFDLPIDTLLRQHGANVLNLPLSHPVLDGFIKQQKDAVTNILLRYNTELLDIYRFYSSLEVELSQPSYVAPVLPFTPQSPTHSLLTKDSLSTNPSNVSSRLNLGQFWIFLQDIQLLNQRQGSHLTLAEVNRIVMTNTSQHNHDLIEQLSSKHDPRQVLLLREFAMGLVRIAETLFQTVEEEEEQESRSNHINDDAKESQRDMENGVDEEDDERKEDGDQLRQEGDETNDANDVVDDASEDASLLYARQLANFNSYIMSSSSTSSSSDSPSSSSSATNLAASSSSHLPTTTSSTSDMYLALPTTSTGSLQSLSNRSINQQQQPSSSSQPHPQQQQGSPHSTKAHSRQHSRQMSIGASSTHSQQHTPSRIHTSRSRKESLSNAIVIPQGGSFQPFSSSTASTTTMNHPTTIPSPSLHTSRVLAHLTGGRINGPTNTLSQRFRRFIVEFVLPHARTRSKHGFSGSSTTNVNHVGSLWNGATSSREALSKANIPIYRTPQVKYVIRKYEVELFNHIFLNNARINLMDGIDDNTTNKKNSSSTLIDRTIRLVDLLSHLRHHSTCFNTFFTLHHAIEALFGSEGADNASGASIQHALGRECIWEEMVEVITRIAIARGKVLGDVASSLQAERAAVAILESQRRKAEEDALAAAAAAAAHALSGADFTGDASNGSTSESGSVSRTKSPTPGGSKVGSAKGAKSPAAAAAGNSKPSTAGKKGTPSAISPKNVLTKKDLKKVPTSMNVTNVLPSALSPVTSPVTTTTTIQPPPALTLPSSPLTSPTGSTSSSRHHHHSHVSIGGGESGSLKKRSSVSNSILDGEDTHPDPAIAAAAQEAEYEKHAADTEHLLCSLLNKPLPDGLHTSFPVNLLMV